MKTKIKTDESLVAGMAEFCGWKLLSDLDDFPLVWRNTDGHDVDEDYLHHYGSPPHAWGK